MGDLESTLATTPSSRSGASAVGLELAGVLAFGLLLGATMHASLWSRLGEVLPGEAGSDVFRAHWSAWLLARELPGWPFGSTWAHHPYGIDLLPFPSIGLTLVSPITRYASAEHAVGVLVLAYTVFAVFGGWGLVRALGGRFGGGVLAGALVATQPIFVGALLDGTLEVHAVGWMAVTLACMVRACRGSLWAGAFTALAFLGTCLESIYYGSFTALALIFCLLSLRSRRGLASVGLATCLVVLGTGLLALVFREVLAGVTATLAMAESASETVRVSNAANFGVLERLAIRPRSMDMTVGTHYAPPLAHWLAFGIGALLVLRRHAWLVALGCVYVLLAQAHPWTSLWDQTPLGEPVRFPRRYMAAVGVVFGAAVGVGVSNLASWRTTGRWRVVEPVVGVLGAIWLGTWGLYAGGWRESYPLVELPEPEFVQALVSDPEDCAVVFLPLEVPGTPGLLRSELPVFADLHASIASSDHLFLQTRIGKRGWTTPSLLTLARRDGRPAELLRNLNDLSFASVDLSVPKSAYRTLADSEDDLGWLRGEGLKYLVVDDARYVGEAGAFARELLEEISVGSESYSDGTGVTIYRLYDERPPATEVPTTPVDGVSDTRATFGGRVVAVPSDADEIVVIPQVGVEDVRCPVDPELMTFQCPAVSRVDHLAVELDGVRHEAGWTGELSGAIVRILSP